MVSGRAPQGRNQCTFRFTPPSACNGKVNDGSFSSIVHKANACRCRIHSLSGFGRLPCFPRSQRIVPRCRRHMNLRPIMCPLCFRQSRCLFLCFRRAAGRQRQGRRKEKDSALPRNTAYQALHCGEEKTQTTTSANRTIRRVTFDTPRKRQRQNCRYALNPTIRTKSRGGGSSLCPNELQVRPSASGMIGRLSGEEAVMVRTEWNVY